MIMITDGVIGETHQARQIVHRLHERTTSCSFIRVGPYDPGTGGQEQVFFQSMKFFEFSYHFLVIYDMNWLALTVKIDQTFNFEHGQIIVKSSQSYLLLLKSLLEYFIEIKNYDQCSFVKLHSNVP